MDKKAFKYLSNAIKGVRIDAEKDSVKYESLEYVKGISDGAQITINVVNPEFIEKCEKDAKISTEKHVAIAQDWTESERGWGRRPDGTTLHLTKEDCQTYIKEYNAKFNSSQEVPDEYTFADGSPYAVYVTKEQYEEIKNSKIHGIWTRGHIAIEKVV